MEVDIDAAAIGKPGQWLEILGSGMVHPNVISNCGLDPDKYQGFAFGMGLDRIAMLKYGIPDLRDMFAADLRWLTTLRVHGAGPAVAGWRVVGLRRDAQAVHPATIATIANEAAAASRHVTLAPWARDRVATSQNI